MIHPELLIAWVIGMALMILYVATHKKRNKRTALPNNWTQIRRQVIERAGFRCEICNRQSAYFHIDHILPRSKGGTSELSNLRCLCPQCHLRHHPYNRKLKGLVRKQTGRLPSASSYREDYLGNCKLCGCKLNCGNIPVFNSTLCRNCQEKTRKGSSVHL
jgi:hypothetical protein